MTKTKGGGADPGLRGLAEQLAKELGILHGRQQTWAKWDAEQISIIEKALEAAIGAASAVPSVPDLRKYLRHTDECYRSRFDTKPVQPCTCGLIEILKAEASAVPPSPELEKLLNSIRLAAAGALSYGHQATPIGLERMVERKEERLRTILQLLASVGVTGSVLRDEAGAEASGVPASPQWLPIASAPKDGRPIWICEAHGFQCGAWLVDGRWQPWGPNVYAIVPTHWMPLPDPPGATDTPK